jgi:hypothetical protein
MDINDVIGLSVEGTLSLMLVVLAYKLYKMKIKSHSGCCLENGLNGIVLETQNSGVSTEDDIISNNL